jgi:hypothetical protein
MYQQQLQAQTYTLRVDSALGGKVDVTTWVINKRNRVVDVQTVQIEPPSPTATAPGVASIKVSLPAAPSRWIIEVDSSWGGGCALAVEDWVGNTVVNKTPVNGDARWVFDV